MKAFRSICAVALLLGLSACGGGGGDSAPPPPPPVQNTWDQMSWDAGVWA